MSTNLNDLTSKIIDFECGLMDDEEQVVALFQDLYNTGMIYGLQGHYQRTFNALLAEGLVST